MQAALLEGLAEACQSQLSNWTLLLCGTQTEAGRGRQGPVGRPWQFWEGWVVASHSRKNKSGANIDCWPAGSGTTFHSVP